MEEYRDKLTFADMENIVSNFFEDGTPNEKALLVYEKK